VIGPEWRSWCSYGQRLLLLLCVSLLPCHFIASGMSFRFAAGLTLWKKARRKFFSKIDMCSMQK
jgi:hypothetical protein